MQNQKKTILLGQDDQSVEVLTKISPTSRRIIIRINQHRKAELIIPKRTSMKTALAFLYSKEQWIIRKSNQQPQMVEFNDGVQIPIQGELRTITHGGGLRGITHIDGDNLVVFGPPESIARKVKTYLHDLAKKELTARCQIEAAKLGVKYSSITIRDTTSRWGSCSHTHSLSFSWRLILAPKEVLNYVAAHEVAHIIELNHSDRFWNIVASISPNYEKYKGWLKQYGGKLHVYG
jgi:predicted metal-dependent hydrolase